MSDEPATDNSEHLPLYVGYAAVAKRLGVSKRSIYRAVRNGTFPPPIELTSGRRCWDVETIKAHLKERERALVADAVSNPEDLEPEDLVPTMRELGARLISDHLGEPVAADEVRFLIERSATNDELTSCRAQFLDKFEGLCGHFTFERALTISASLFPLLREHLVEIGALRGSLTDPEVLRECAIDILDDEVWAELEAAEQAAAAKPGSPTN